MDQNYSRHFRILVVDDETIIRQVIADSLSEEGYQVDQAESGERALELLQSSRFDVVITDITMAKVSGIDLLFKIKEINPETEVILITAYASLETAEAAVAGKAYRYLRKPFNDIDDVIKIVQEAVCSRLKKEEERERLQDLISQRNRLEKRLGQLETMYSISHAISFPEDTVSLFRDIAVLLYQVLKPDLLACYVDEKATPEFGGLFVVLTRPFQEKTIEQLVATIPAEKDRHEKIHIDRIYLRKAPPLEKLGALTEIAFPNYSAVQGTLYIAYSEPKRLSEEEEQLLEVTTAQIAGTIGKLIELRRKERERLKSLFEGMVDGVVLFRQGGAISIANKATFAMLESHTPEELQARFEQLALTSKIDNIREGKWTLGKTITLQSGKIVSVTILPLESWEAVSIMVLRDISEHTKMQEELERSRRLSLIGELAAGVVHELNTPLAIMLGYAQLIMDQPLSEEMKNDVKNILEETQRCKKIVGNLLDLAPSKNQERMPVDLREVVEKVHELTRHGLRKANIKVAVDCPPQPVMIDADSGQIQQVLLNLIKNSQDAMEGQETEKILEIHVWSDGDKIYLKVEDTGPGIPGKYMEQLFNPFFTTKPAGKGSGLGLSICHKIIREHSGRIWCKNRLQGGASFTMEFSTSSRKI